MKKKPEPEPKPTHATCWVCVERGIKKEYPIDTLQDCGRGVYRCRGHRGATILKAGKMHEQERKGKTMVITIPSFQITVEVI